MPDHYYSSKPGSNHDFHYIEVSARGIHLKLRTDAGVFSKERLDPGTRLLIESLPLGGEFKTILDLGCGYGPIGLVIAKLLPGSQVYLIDVNERAVELAAGNAELNGITNIVIKSGGGLNPVAEICFDLIVTNPPVRAGKHTVYGLVEAAYHSLNLGGWFYAVILTRQGAKSLERKMEEVFNNVSEIEKGGGYRVVASRK